jgi:hypothetical protein
MKSPLQLRRTWALTRHLTSEASRRAEAQGRASADPSVPSPRTSTAMPAPLLHAWTNALRGQKWATLGHFGPRTEANADPSVPFSNRCLIRIYVITMRSVRFKKPVGPLASPSDHARSKIWLQKLHDNGRRRAGSSFPTIIRRTSPKSTCNGSAGWHPSAPRREEPICDAVTHVTHRNRVVSLQSEHPTNPFMTQ